MLTFTGYRWTSRSTATTCHRPPDYVGFKPQWLAERAKRTIDALNGDALVTLTTEVRPYDNQEPTVQAFYEALSDKHYEDAYAFLSPAFKANNPFDS